MRQFRQDGRSDHRKPRSEGGRNDPRGSGRRDFRGSGRGDFRESNKGDFRGSSRGGYSEPKEMHRVICDKCGKRCEVPFKPTSSKPIYCNTCFRSDDSSDRPSKSGRDDLLVEMNKKLDKIMKSLDLL